MNKNLRWKVITILAVVAVSVLLFYPPSQKVKLGLDLKGGVHLVLRVQTDQALKLETDLTAEHLREAATEKGIIGLNISTQPPTTIKISGVPPNQDAQFRALANEQSANRFDINPQTGGSYTMTMKLAEMTATRDSAVQQALQTIERRVNELGVSEPIVAPHGTAGNQILVQLPGVTDVARAKNIIRSTAMLQMEIIEGGPAESEQALIQQHGGTIPPDLIVMPGADNSPGNAGRTVYYLVKRVPPITGSDLRDAKAGLDENNLPAVIFTMTRQGADKFGKLTGDNVNKPLAIILDHKIQSVANIQERIRENGRITGNFTQEEVQDISLMLRSGALPTDLSYEEERTVGPTLGADSIRAGVTASIGGLILVALFMLVYYKLSGVNAIVSIVLNLVILLGFMAQIGAVMTLPGIAGFILTIGMGVDSNVLIFERIKEELAGGKGPRAAINAGFDRVFLTIMDTHISSLISALFLFQFGTGPIRGFATTLVFGLLANVFTAVFVSRTLFELELSARRQPSTISI
jgi:preprotein translocase subunit SecD